MHVRRMPSPTVKRRDGGAAPAITTTFVPPPQCTQGQLTMLGRQQYFVWQNEPVPADGITIGSCYPQQFITSYLASMAGTSLPAFSPLVCPQNYHTHSQQDLGADTPYIVCCPTNYLFHSADNPDPNRPGAGGTCYSNILSTTVTKYDENSYSGLIFFSTSGQAYAHPLDGFAFDGQHAATTEQPIAAPTSANPPPATSQAPPATVVTKAGSTSATPESASTLTPQSHDQVSQSSSPSQTPLAISLSTAPSSVIPLSTQGSSVIYSTVQPSIITIYSPVSIGSSAATSQPSSQTSPIAVQSSDLGTGSKVGIAIGAILGILLLGALAFSLLRRRRAHNTPTELANAPPYVLGKPNLADHPSTRGYPNEKQNYNSPVMFHELNSPQMETHELGAGRDGEPVIKELDAAPAYVPDGEEFGNFTHISTFSPGKG